MNGVDIDRLVSAWQLRDFDGVPLDTDQTPLARAIRHGESSQRNFMIRRPSQEDRSVSASAVPIRDESGVVKAAVIVFEDITERMRVDAVLREAQAVLQQRFAIQTNELDAAKVLEKTGNKAQAALQQRFASQSTELDAAKVLEKTGNKARAVLEKRFVVQGNALREARSDLQSEKDLHRAPKIRNNSDDTALVACMLRRISRLGLPLTCVSKLKIACKSRFFRWRVRRSLRWRPNACCMNCRSIRSSW